MEQRDILVLYESLVQHLHGEWILVGGALLHVLDPGNRETLAIDIVPVHDITNRDQLRIMELADNAGFAPEVINFGADYFVKKQPGWQDELIVLYQSDTLTLYRPTKKLFRSMKQQRGSETDLSDIALYETLDADE
jgi:hypothetical protein